MTASTENGHLPPKGGGVGMAGTGAAGSEAARQARWR